MRTCVWNRLMNGMSGRVFVSIENGCNFRRYASVVTTLMEPKGDNIAWLEENRVHPATSIFHQ